VVANETVTMLKITLDTCEIINADRSVLLIRLKELISQGKIDVAVTTRVIADKDQDQNLARKKTHLNALDEYPTIGTNFRLDFSRLGSGDFLIGEDLDLIGKKIEHVIFTEIHLDDKHSHNKWADVDHLIGHYQSGRDVFVTEDLDILKKHRNLHELGIEVESLQTFVKRMNNE